MSNSLCPCLDCGRLTRNGSRCGPHAAARAAAVDAQRGPRPHYGGAWPRLSRAVRKASPRCADCGATTDLTADHVVPRSLSGGLTVLCRPCNSAKKDRR